jgi:hypothetical protein
MTGEDILKVRDQLASQRSVMIQHWRECADVYMPFATVNQDVTNVYRADQLHDSTGRQAALIMANGLATLICPREEEFFEYVPPEALKKEETAKRAYREATEIARSYLQSSNFWEEMGEALIELPVYGTASLYCGDLDDRGELYFRNQCVGTYYISEDAYGRVSCHYRDLRLTAEQASQEFGEENLSDEIRTKLKLPEGKTEKFNFVHGVGRKTSYRKDQKAPESQDGEWYDIVVDEKTKKVVVERSYKEFPFAVCRYRRMGKCVWGWGPGAIVKGTAWQLSSMNDLADIAIEKAAMPPTAVPSGLEGQTDLGAGGVTFYDSNDPNSKSPIYEIGGQSDIGELQWLMERRERQVNEAFHVPMFQIFTQMAMEGREMTATEANYIHREKLTQFSPVYGRIVSEMLDRVLERIFNVLLRAGAFGDTFDKLVDPANPTRRMIPKPSLLYKNQIVLAMQAQQNRSFLGTMSLVSPLVQQFPDLLDVFNLDETVAGLARNEGLPEEWIRLKRDIDKIRAARAQAQDQANKLAAAQQASEVAANMGKAPASMQPAA